MAGGEAPRVLVDPVCSLLRSSKKTPVQKGIIRSVACGCYVTTELLNKWGYEVPQRCPLCQAPDGLFHRLRKCPATQQLRAKVIPRELMAKVPAREDELSPELGGGICWLMSQ